MKQAMLSFVILLGTLNAAAQSEKKTIFGFKGGWNKSIVKGYELNGSKTGYIGFEWYGAFFADTRLSENWHLENELLVSYTEDYHFVEIPIHLKYRFEKKWFVLVGPKLDIIADDDNDPYEAPFYRFRNLGVSGEIGVQYHFLKRFFAETRYSRSFMKQIDELGLENYGGKTNTIRIGLGVKF